MARLGVGLIETDEGMAALEVLLGTAVDQGVFVKTTKPSTDEKGRVAELLWSPQLGQPSVIANLQGQ
jgi:hypothetical protein